MCIICGIDEAGRGPLAGPVTAGAVILPPMFDYPLADSKRLSANRRMAAYRHIVTYATAWATGWAWPEEIDRYNIHVATLLAMRRAYFALESSVDEVLVDGLYIPSLPCTATAIVKGDSFVPEIQAASIIAKTARDAWMIRYSWIEPEYGYDKHKGYPTKAHRDVCSRVGPSPIQRVSFKIST